MHVALVHISRGVDGTPVSPMVDHLGLGMLAAVLRKNGHAVTLLDTGPLQLDLQGLKTHLLDAAPDLVGFSLNYVNAAESIALASELHAHTPDILVAAGGLYATFHTEPLLRRGMDAVVLGEGELPLVRLAEAGAKKKAWEKTPGLSWMQGDVINSTPPLPGLPIDELPPAARDSLASVTRMPRGCYKIALEASRGCRYACRFCSIAAAQRLSGTPGVRRTRPPSDVAREMGAIIRDYGVRDFWFMDADFLGNRDELRRHLEISEAIGSIGESLAFEIDTRADAVTPEAIAALKSAGLCRVFLGVESFDQSTLDLLGKGATAEGNRRAVAILEESGVRPILGSIMFHPQSTLHQLRREHAALSGIGYEKTQMLFRLKKYRGSRDAGMLDCDGRGVSFYEDYGWEFDDPVIKLAWTLFDRARLQLMDAVFVDMTTAFKRGELDVPTFEHRADQIFYSLAECVEYMLRTLERPNASRLIGEKEVLISEMDELVAALLKSAADYARID